MACPSIQVVQQQYDTPSSRNVDARAHIMLFIIFTISGIQHDVSLLLQHHGQNHAGRTVIADPKLSRILQFDHV